MICMPKILSSQGAFDISLPATAPGGGEYPMICPICTPTRKSEHQKEKKLSVQMLDLKDGKMRWRCNHCGEGGYVHENIDFNEKHIKPLENHYLSSRPEEKFYDWLLKTRGISKVTAQAKGLYLSLSRENVLQSKNTDPSKKDKWINCQVINFKYFYNNELINIKYRDQRKNFKLISKAAKIFFNIDSIKDFKYAVIVEGEFDVYAYREAGVIPVVSVPNGVNISVEEKKKYETTGDASVFGTINMEYLDLCISDFEHLETIYIATDDDPAGIKLREELARRLRSSRCKFIRFSDWGKNPKTDKNINDPNELLIVKGKAALSDSLNRSHEFPIRNVTSAMDYWEDIELTYKHGLSKGLTSGYKSLDPHFRWVKGWTVALNGYPGEGKTSFAFNLLAISSIIHGFKWGIFSPENYPVTNIIDTLIEILLNNTTSDEYGGNRLSLSEMKAVTRDHINKHFFFVDSDDGFTPKELRVIKRELITKKGINGFFTDPWSALTHPTGMTGREDIYIRNELNAETRLSGRYQIINMISHHPPTPDRKKLIEVPTPFNMIGGQIWFNKVYSILCIHKVDRSDPSDPMTGIHVQKNKEHKISGIPTKVSEPVLMRFLRRSNRLLEATDLNNPNSGYKRYPFSKWEIKGDSLFEGF